MTKHYRVNTKNTFKNSIKSNHNGVVRYRQSNGEIGELLTNKPIFISPLLDHYSNQRIVYDFTNDNMFLCIRKVKVVDGKFVEVLKRSKTRAKFTHGVRKQVRQYFKKHISNILGEV